MSVFRADSPSFSGELLYHYTSSAGLAGILDSGNIRLSPLSMMNDPRESKEFNFGAVSGIGRDVPELYSTPEFQADLRDLVNSILRDDVRVFAATRDEADNGRGGHWARGFARARNWDQYAEKHRGAVLVLDREALVEATQGVEGVKSVLHSAVSYHDRQVEQADSEWLVFDADRLDQVVPSEIIEGWRDTVSDHLYFEKALDWSSEREYRLVAFSDREVRVPIAAAIRGVVLGEYFPVPEARVLATRLRRIGVERLNVMQMTWESGHPGATTIGLQYPGLFVSEWSEQIIPLFDGEAPPPVEVLNLMCPWCGTPMVRTDAGLYCKECQVTTNR